MNFFLVYCVGTICEEGMINAERLGQFIIRILWYYIVGRIFHVFGFR